jgi:phospholipid/cholesterol/gamma-HCH transport system ATP-binding protein
MAEPLIEFKNVTKSFGGNTVLKNVDLSIYEGEITTIIGKSGVGKSVFLKHIIGLLHPDEGEVLFRGRKISDMTKEERHDLKRQFSYMFQNNALFDSLTVFQNIALPLEERTNMQPTEIHRKVTSMMDDLELSRENAPKFPSQLSGGMQKRVALARALITDPKIVLFDEPTTGLDPIRKNAVLSMITHYQKKFGFTAILVSHDIPDAFYISDRIAIIENQSILFQGTPVDLEQIRDQTVEQFINSLESLKDELTGLETRQQLENFYNKEMERLKLFDEPFSILLLTVENLDAIKENAGHIAAQRLIQGIARMTRERLKTSDVIGRYSPDTILAVLPRTDSSGATRLEERLAREMSQQEILRVSNYPGDCRDFVIKSGTAQVDNDLKLGELVVKARNKQSILGTVYCETQENRVAS